LSHDIVAEAWRLLPWAAAIGIRYELPQCKYRLTVNFEGGSTWTDIEPGYPFEHKIIDACDRIASEFGKTIAGGPPQ
jgi:hypothetical protein